MGSMLLRAAIRVAASVRLYALSWWLVAVLLRRADAVERGGFDPNITHKG